MARSSSLLVVCCSHLASPVAVLPMLIIGCIAFLPGFYHSRIAYLAWRGYRGYSMNMIPDV